MNPIKIQEYKEYKQIQKQTGKEFQWHEFLKLNKSQYLNFRVSVFTTQPIKYVSLLDLRIDLLQNDFRNRAASRLSRGEPISHQQKGKVEAVIKDVSI
jgi:hypothetical protein